MMLEFSDRVWIGDSHAERSDALKAFGITGILIAAHDMPPTKGWLDECMVARVPIIDGPGNSSAMYAAAVTTLHALLVKRSVLVCCHTGGRARAIATLYMALMARREWDEVESVVAERVDLSHFPVVNSAHKQVLKELRCVKLL